MNKRITLSAWLSNVYGEDGPTINTARRWCKNGLIHPMPEKHGREYYLTPDARYVGKEGPTLLERIIGSPAPQHT